MGDEGLRATRPELTVPEPVIEIDQSRQIVACNDAATTLLEGRDPVGAGLDSVDPDELFDAEMLEPALESDTVTTYERYLSSAAQHYEVRAYPSEDGLTLLCLPRRERTGNGPQGQAVTPASPDRFRALVEHSSDVITHIDPDGTITYVSATVSDLLGYEPEALVGENALAHVHPEDETAYLDRLNALLDEPERTVTVQYRFKGSDGSWIWLESTGRNELTTPAIEGIVLVSRDITARKQYENRLERQRDDLELLNQVVRHDIRNDLQLILTHGELLADRFEANESVNAILGSATNAIDRTRDARLLAEVLLGSDDGIDSKPLRSTVEEQVRRVETAYETATVELEGQIPAVDVRANEMLDSVFDNLLTNAVVHNDSEEPRVIVSGDLGDAEATIRLSDNGSGIPPSLRDSLFERGEKGPDSEGTGLGLYLVSTLVEQYGGRITVAETGEAGTTMQVSLPLAV